MSHTRMDQDIDLALDDVPPVRYIRPAQPYVIASRAVMGVAVLIASGSLYGGFTGALTLESKALPLLFVAMFICGVVAYLLANTADRIDTPAILIDDQEV